MVHIKTPLPLYQDGSIDTESWITALNIPAENQTLIKDACQLAQLTGEDKLTKYGTTCFAQGLEVAEIIQELQFDKETLAATIVYSTVEHAGLTIDDVEAQLGKNVAQLVVGTQQMNTLNKIPKTIDLHNAQQIDNIRKMLLTMVQDVRVVVIKLAERLFQMRALRKDNSPTKHALAQITMDVFAPLANRLGLHQIKWELEDLAFLYLEPEVYKDIAKHLAARRSDREQHVKQITNKLDEQITQAKVNATIYGRAKHIYSIRKKMQRKNVSFAQIYDTIAVRILVNTIDECYTALSIAHELWEPIPEEFDDYVSSPKQNGYQSIHTAVIDKEGRFFEIQIRTHAMHEEAEKGVAAHWMYKEGKKQKTIFEEKINWLRNLLEWQKELTHDETFPLELEKNVFEDRVFVFTPAGDIIDLPTGSTPLDFAYHIHTEVGHRCRGAKVNNKIAPLTYQIKTGDEVAILTTKYSNPSRDWLITKRGYLKTSTARAKVLQWFKLQDFATHAIQGKEILEKEAQRLHIEIPNLAKIAKHFNHKSVDHLLAALGNNNLRLAQIINLIQPSTEQTLSEPTITTVTQQKTSSKNNILIHGIDNLLSHIAKCCKPIPGDPIIGYITQNHGVTIHHDNCTTINNLKKLHPDRLIEVSWISAMETTFQLDIEILAHDRPGLARDITATLANDKINMINLNISTNQKLNSIKFIATIEIHNLSALGPILDHIHQIPNVYDAKRKLSASAGTRA